MTVGVKDAFVGASLTMEVDTIWSSSRAANGYTHETVSIAGYNRSFDTYDGQGGGTLTAGGGNDALLYDTTGSTKLDANMVPVADAHHVAGIGVFDMGLGDDVLDLTSSGGGVGSYGTGVSVYGDASGTLPYPSVGGNDVVWTGGGDDTIYGDTFEAAGARCGNDRLHGGAGNDTIYGDFLQGGAVSAGDDLIDGGTGDDILYGDGRTFFYPVPPGHNTFAFDGPGSGNDTIAPGIFSFQHGLDHIRLDADYGYTAAQALAHTTDVGGNAVVDLGNGDSITLVGVTTSQLDASDFVIA